VTAGAPRDTGPEPFVLDLPSNPHKRLLREALYYRSIQFDSPTAMALWHGYLLAMCGATGLPIGDLTAWLDHHAGGPMEPSPVAVEIRR
jgi:hypothetical protein